MVSGQHPLGSETGEQEQVMDTTKTCFFPTKSCWRKLIHFDRASPAYALDFKNMVKCESLSPEELQMQCQMNIRGRRRPVLEEEEEEEEEEEPWVENGRSPTTTTTTMMTTG